MSHKKSVKVRACIEVQCPKCQSALRRLPDHGLMCSAGESCEFSAAGTVLDDMIEMDVVPKKKEKEPAGE